jgi:CheY-like chemotaxis protein
MAAIRRQGLNSESMADSIGAAGSRSVDPPAATSGCLGMVGHDWPIRQALRVLVVDDHESTADAIVWLVRQWGHAAYSASSSVAALRIASARHLDVVLLDMEMPQMDGYQLAKQLRLNSCGRSGCFIVAYTKQCDDSLRRRCTRSGIDLVLIKPIDPALLEILLLLESDLVNRSQDDKNRAPRVPAKIQHLDCLAR